MQQPKYNYNFMKYNTEWTRKMKATATTLFVAILMLAATTTASSQHKAKDLFVNMPDSVLPMLTAVNRADCIDFLESNMKARVENRFGKTTEMTILGDDYISINMTPNSTWQMKLLPLNDSTQVVCTVSTVCASVCDSDIRFYDDKWTLLPVAEYLPASPTTDDFLIAPTDSTYAQFQTASLALDMQLMKVDLAKENQQLTFTYTTPEYIETETAEKLNPFLRRQFIYNWDSVKFLPLQTAIDE